MINGYSGAIGEAKAAQKKLDDFQGERQMVGPQMGMDEAFFNKLAEIIKESGYGASN